MSGKKEFGDYQTPSYFSDKVCEYLKDLGITPTIVLEPTCGIGNFLASSKIFNAKNYIGIETNASYCKLCNERFLNEDVTIINDDIFGCDLSLITGKDDVLIIGNPPWVTNSTLSALESDNLPQKENFKNLKGMDALTGASNFDICEYIILQIVHSYIESNAVVAMLCKTSVARNVFQELKRDNISFEYCNVYEFDSKKVFDVSASACLLLIKLGKDIQSPDYCDVYDFDNNGYLKSRFGYQKGIFYSNLNSEAEDFAGACCFEWRQGVKHDCSKIMELRYIDGKFVNGNKEILSIEEDIVFPLIKSSMFKSPIIDKFDRYVIVTQKKPREDTSYLENLVPRTWKYLNDNVDIFINRKSSIYKGAPHFSMFGVGDYSYAPYKVGVSGFYKKPMFSVLYSKNLKAVMTDDTSYFICFEEYKLAYVAMLLLNSEKVQRFLTSIAFLDAKRPYTKKVLERIDFSKILKRVDFNDLVETEVSLNLDAYLTTKMLYEFAEHVQHNSKFS